MPRTVGRPVEFRAAEHKEKPLVRFLAGDHWVLAGDHWPLDRAVPCGVGLDSPTRFPVAVHAL